MADYIQYLNDHAVEQWEYQNHIDCHIVQTPTGHYCGYATFPKPLLKERGYYGIVTYVPVHGGITLTEHNADGNVTYGFDCAHASDHENPQLQDLDWLKQETERMALSIAIAADGYEEAYLQAETDKDRADVVDAYHTKLREEGVADFILTDNFGAMINVLLGGKV